MTKAILRTIGVFLFLLHATASWTQIVAIPDANFKYKILQHNPVIDLNQDGDIQQSEAEAFTGFMDISYMASDPGHITDVTGLEAFVNLTEFKASYQQIQEIDLSSNTFLQMYDASGNPYSSLSFTNHPFLEAFQSNFGNLTNLDFSGAPNLVFLNAQGNQLQEIDLSTNNFLQGVQLDDNPIIAFDFSQNPLLRYLNCQNNQITTLDLSNNPILISVDCRENTQLTYLNIKNGNNEGLNLSGSGPSCAFYDLPLLETVCLDAIDSPLANFIEDHVQHNITFMEECALGISNPEVTSISVFPNPTTGLLYIHSITPMKTVTVFNALGTLVLEQKVDGFQSEINLEALSSGLYFLRIDLTNDKASVSKIILR